MSIFRCVICHCDKLQMLTCINRRCWNSKHQQLQIFCRIVAASLSSVSSLSTPNGCTRRKQFGSGWLHITDIIIFHFHSALGINALGPANGKCSVTACFCGGFLVTIAVLQTHWIHVNWAHIYMVSFEVRGSRREFTCACSRDADVN